MPKKKEKKFKKEIEIKGTMRFSNIDTHRAVMELEDPQGIISIPRVKLDPGLFPHDFKLSRYDVEGTYEFTVVIKGK